MNILTFDIEEWFHILDNDSTKTIDSWAQYESRLDDGVNRILDLLDETGHSATFFVLGWVAEKYPNVVKKIDSLGYEIGSHSHFHQLAYEQSRKEYSEDLKKSIFAIEDIIGKKVITYRAPGFSIKEENMWAFECLLENGIEIDASVFPTARAHGGFENFGFEKPGIIEFEGMVLKEFPMNLARVLGKDFVFSGGGYFRVLPYFIQNRFWAKSPYIMTYFHPRDFDPEQPIIDGLSLTRRFKSYYGLGHSLQKLKKILKNNSFMDIRTAEKEIDWNIAPRVIL